MKVLIKNADGAIVFSTDVEILEGEAFVIYEPQKTSGVAKVFEDSTETSSKQVPVSGSTFSFGVEPIISDK